LERTGFFSEPPKIYIKLKTFKKQYITEKTSSFWKKNYLGTFKIIYKSIKIINKSIDKETKSYFTFKQSLPSNILSYIHGYNITAILMVHKHGHRTKYGGDLRTKPPKNVYSPQHFLYILF